MRTLGSTRRSFRGEMLRHIIVEACARSEMAEPVLESDVFGR